MSRSNPLLWPAGRPRTRMPKTSNFTATLDQAERGVYYQLRMLGASNVVITSNLSVRADGVPYVRQTSDDTGIAVYFDYSGSRHCVAIDRYRYFWENMRAIEKSLEAIRGLERWGGAEIVKTSLGGFKELPAQAIVTPYSARPWHEVLEVLPTASLDVIEAAYRRLAKVRHPDAPYGSEAAFLELKNAHDQALDASRAA